MVSLISNRLDFAPRLNAAFFKSLRLPSRWKCDVCDQIIEAPASGWVEWHTYPGATNVDRIHRDARIVLKRRTCLFPPEQSTSFSIGSDTIQDFQNLRALRRLLNRTGPAKLNPDPMFIRIAWRLLIYDFDFGNTDLCYY